jgi:hypothetical protein
MDELIVHIGPPKTATTELQQALKCMGDYLASQNVLFDLPPTMAAHSLLAEVLGAHKKNRKREGRFASDPTADAFPSLAETGRQLITSEALFTIDAQGVERLFEWAKADTVLVVAAVREPIKWLWSYWQQRCKSPGCPEWPDFVEFMTLHKVLFPSSLINPWVTAGVSTQFAFFELDRPHSQGPLREFLRAIKVQEMPTSLQSPSSRNLNSSMGPMEALLTASLVDEIEVDLRERSWVRWGNLPEGFISRTCVDLIDNSRPMYELGRWYGCDLDGPIVNSIFDRSSLDALSRYREYWIRDALQTSAHTQVTDGGRSALENCALRYESAPLFEGFTGPWGEGFPQRNFKNSIELPGYFQPLARSLSAAIGLRWKASLRDETHSDDASAEPTRSD